MVLFADAEVDWSELVPGTTRADAWESFSMSPGNGGWDAVLPGTPGGPERTNNRNGCSAEGDNPSNDRPFRPRESYNSFNNSGGDGRGRGRGGRGNDWGGRGGGRGNDWGGRGNDWGGRGRGRGPPREPQPEIEPENKEIDDLVKSMRRILKQYVLPFPYHYFSAHLILFTASIIIV